MLEATEPVTYEFGTSARLVGDFYGQLQAEYDRSWQERQKMSKSPTAGEYWLARQRNFVDQSAPLDVRVLDFELRLMDMRSMERYSFKLNDCKLPKDTRVPRGVYSVNVIELNGVASSVWKNDWYLDLNSSHVDFTRAQKLNDAELYALLEPPKPVEPEVAPIVFKRTARTAGDAASRLGFVVGARDEDIVLPNRHGWHAFHLSHPVIVGAVEATVDAPPSMGPHAAVAHVSFALYDAAGTPLISTTLEGSHGPARAQFDEVRLEPQDYLLVWCGPSLKGTASYKNSHTGLFHGQVPSHPLLDELLKQRPLVEGLQPMPVGMPEFRFK